MECFFLGTHQPGWLSQQTVPLFVSDRRLRDYKTLPRSAGSWALDSGGFTELSAYGTWAHGPTPAEYVARVHRYDTEVGNLCWAAPQDWMCEPFITAKTGLTVEQHQALTVSNFVLLKTLWARLDTIADSPFIPVLQGYAIADYQRCADMYATAGVDLEEQFLVGLGSVCRREATDEIGAVVESLHPLPLHGFGVKTAGLRLYGHLLESADSMAWSFSARRDPALPECAVDGRHINCANCPRYALRWRERILASLTDPDDPQQLALYPAA